MSLFRIHREVRLLLHQLEWKRPLGELLCWSGKLRIIFEVNFDMASIISMIDSKGWWVVRINCIFTFVILGHE